MSINKELVKDLREAQAENAKLQARIEELELENGANKFRAEIAGKRNRELEAELHGTVTTKYHDKIVQEAMNRIAELEAVVERAALRESGAVALEVRQQSELLDVTQQRDRLQAEVEGLRKLLYTEGWTDDWIDRAIFNQASRQRS